MIFPLSFDHVLLSARNDSRIPANCFQGRLISMPVHRVTSFPAHGRADSGNQFPYTGHGSTPCEFGSREAIFSLAFIQTGASMYLMNAIERLHAKMDKLVAMIDHPSTPAHEAEAAYQRWSDLATKARKMEIAMKVVR